MNTKTKTKLTKATTEGEERYYMAEQRDTAQHFGIKDGRPTLILGDNRSTDEQLKSAQIQIQCDRETINGLQTHAQRLAEALKELLQYPLASGSIVSAWDIKDAREALAVWERSAQ